MSDRLYDLEVKLGELAESVRQIERRLSAVERGAAAAHGSELPPPAASPPGDGEDPDFAILTRALSLGGRVLLVLAGAFVLRALTDAGAVPTWLGVGLGVAYAAGWLVLADRAGRASAPGSAVAHGSSAMLVGFPLVFEAASRFQLLSPSVAALLLAGLTAGALAVAVRRRLQAVGWVATAAGAMTALALMAASGRLAALAVYLVLLGVATLWLGYVQGWTHLRWVVAPLADVAVVVLSFRALDPSAIEGPATAIAVQLLLLALYLASIAARTLVLRRRVVPFEVAQTVAALLVGLGGAWLVAMRSGMGGTTFGVVSLALGGASYAVAFAFVARRQGAAANFIFYTSVAIALVLAGSVLALPERMVPLGWAACALVCAALARRHQRFTLAAHAAGYGLAAALASGLIASALEAIAAPATAPWPPFRAESLAVLVAMAVSAWLGADATPARRVQRVPQVSLLAGMAVGVAGVAIALLAPALAGGRTNADAGALATVRTAAMVGCSLLLAAVGRRERWREAGWLAYPGLAAAGLKALLEDLRHGRPATLVVTFAVYGAALIIVPRLRRLPTPAAPAIRSP